MKNNKQLSNPFSTGGGGEYFEAHVQSSFVVLMLTGGFAPCIPNWPISKIKLQGRYAGFDTDDLIIFLEKPESGQQRKLLGQIKHSIKITANDSVFREVICAVWNDYNNPSLFTKGKDAIALITGPLSASDIYDVRTILDWARYTENADEFVKKVELAHFSSSKKRSKLRAFRTNLVNANNGNPISDETLFDFLRHFFILGFDLDIKDGVTLALLHTLIGQYSPESVLSVWSQIVDEVQAVNKNAGTISRESVPEEILAAFAQKALAFIPKELSSGQLTIDKSGLSHLPYASSLAAINLIGSWNEKNEADIDAIEQIIGQDFRIWISEIRDILQLTNSPVAMRNGKWRVSDREAMWEVLGPRLFDENLERFRKVCISVLSERSPEFELPSDERYTANVHGKVLEHSQDIRKGLAESLALLGNKSNDLTNCSQGNPETTAILSVREIFSSADWTLWGSTNDLLPILAEAAPDEFLDAVEKALEISPSPFDELFAQESNGIWGRNYLTGILWALETLAWDKKFLVRVSVILGELDTHDPGGNWANRPANSLTTIFLPWLPQTIASIDKRKVAIETLRKEYPDAAWKLLISLLPNQHQVSTGTRQPKWLNTIPDNWKQSVTHQEYWELVSFIAGQAISMASQDMNKLEILISHIDNLPKPSFDEILEHLSSDIIANKPETERLPIWLGLTEFVSKHRRFPDAKWALGNEILLKVESVAKKLEPTDPINFHRRLFGNREFDLYEERGNWEEEQKKLEQRRQKAIEEIFNVSGMAGIFQFVEAVESSYHVGYSLGFIAPVDIDTDLFPDQLNNKDEKTIQFLNGFVIGRQQCYGWNWVDDLDRSGWSNSQKGLFLSYLPFTDKTWNRVATWLSVDEGEYWSKTNVNPYQANCDLSVAIEQLIKFERPNAAIDCLFKIHYDKQPLDKDMSVKALLAAVSSKEPMYTMDKYHIVEIIKALQDDPDTYPENLFQVEWAYLPLLDGHLDAYPKLLENRLASNSDFFCEVIRLLYRSKNDSKPAKEVSEKQKAIATNAWKLLDEWKTPPGIQPDGSFSGEFLNEWLTKVKDSCTASGHLDVALIHIGHVLIYSPPDPQGLWIDHAVADVLNGRDAEELRNGFRLELFNSRGVHSIDPSGEPERELAKKYRKMADEVENASYQRFAATLRELAEEYDREAERIIINHGHEDDE